MALKLNDSPYSVPHLGVSKRLTPTELRAYSENSVFVNKSIWDEDLADGLWTLQVLALWFTNGDAFTQRGKVVQPRIITNRGLRPSDPSPALDPTRAKTDLRSILNPPDKASSTSWVYGPDAKLGPSLTDLLEQYAGTGLVLGNEAPPQVKALLDRTVKRIAQSNAISRVTTAYNNFLKGQEIPIKDVLVETPPAQLTREAADTAGVVRPQDVGTTTTTTTTTPTRTPTPTPTTPTPTPTTPTTSPTASTPPKKEAPALAQTPTDDETPTEEKSNTALYVGLGLLGVVAIGGTALYLQKNKKTSKSATELAKK